MNDLEIAPGFFATPDRYLWHESSATAILSDLHLGAEAELNRRGILMPDVSTAALNAAWQRLSRRLEATGRGANVVIAGDLFDVATPAPAARAQAEELLRMLPPGVCVTLLTGNHDPAPEFLRDWFRDFSVTVAAQTTVGGCMVAHGHELPKSLPAGGLIVGHQHPAVTLRDRVQSAKMICYAVCKLPGNSFPLILLPSFSRAPLGSNLLTTHHWIVNLPRPADGDVRIAGIIEPAADPPQVLDFGPLATLRLPF